MLYRHGKHVTSDLFLTPKSSLSSCCTCCKGMVNTGTSTALYRSSHHSPFCNCSKDIVSIFGSRWYCSVRKRPTCALLCLSAVSPKLPSNSAVNRYWYSVPHTQATSLTLLILLLCLHHVLHLVMMLAPPTAVLVHFLCAGVDSVRTVAAYPATLAWTSTGTLLKERSITAGTNSHSR